MNVLSLDGGGVFGAHTAVILDRIEAACPGTIAKTDMIAGTSVGAMIGLVLAAGHTTKDLIQVFDNVSAIFSTSKLRTVKSYIGLCATYESGGRESVLKQWLGDKKLGDLSKFVVAQSFQLNSHPVWSGKVFHNIPSSVHGECCDSLDMLAVDVGMATSAAPMYFPSHGEYIDGGVTSNNPSVTAIALTQDKSFNWKWNGVSLKDVKVFSIGRNYSGDQVDRSNWDAGWMKWISIVLEMLMTGNQSAVDYQARQLIGKNYFRHLGTIPPELNGNIDGVGIVPGLKIWAEGIDISKEIDWIKKNW